MCMGQRLHKNLLGRPCQHRQLLLSPVHHFASNQAHEPAVIGMASLKKLGLHLDCEQQGLEIDEGDIVAESGRRDVSVWERWTAWAGSYCRTNPRTLKGESEEI